MLGPSIRVEGAKGAAAIDLEPPHKSSSSPWKAELAALRQRIVPAGTGYTEPPRRIFYTVDPDECIAKSALIIQVEMSRLKKDGTWGKPNWHESEIRCVSQLDEVDRRLLGILGSDVASGSYSPFIRDADSVNSKRRVARGALDLLIPMLCSTGRFLLEPSDLPEKFQPLQWDGGEPWKLEVTVKKDEQAEAFVVSGWLKRDGKELAVSEPRLLIPGLVFFGDNVARLNEGHGLQWALLLRRSGDLTVPFANRHEFMAEIAQFPVLPSIELPEGITIDPGRFANPPILKISKPQQGYASRLRCEVHFDYGSLIVPENESASIVHDRTIGRLVRRDAVAEREALNRLSLLGVYRTSEYSLGRGQWEVSPSRVPALVRQLVPEGWCIEAEGNLYRKASGFKINVTSNIDWFELNGQAEFEGEQLALPELLKALGRGENMVRLQDGSFGLLPEDWLKRYRLMASTATFEAAGVRFHRNQAGLLDALLAAQPEVTFDEGFRTIRRELETFGGIQPGDPSHTFTGTLREYQREGLAWLRFLRRFQFGGCLADDMGLGKTVQVLALLDSAERNGPALAVVPRSLVFNWKQEAERFTPRLRVLDLTGADRTERLAHIPDHDLVLTTYGTLRRDAPALKEIAFDTIILDEAQSIKNPETASAKAARLLNGTYRLALTGTPIENHVGDLWSILQFLNPGLLGTATVFRANVAANSDTESLQVISKALRPFILRRTKEQVAPELPPKTEQTIYCELEGDQRRLYVGLRDHYRNALLGRIDDLGIEQSRMHILEALLRLRQAACHPGLIDKKRRAESSSKVDSLVAQLIEVVSEGHKVLVFSQFTTFLAIVKKELETNKLVYEYLDGQTRDRQACVQRFQEDETCSIFLISLKAGGLGLNLTRAEYVFLLDPWWNPAVEAQAIDRSHRIGQTRHVFAYRLISRGTVEEKIVELQKSKRDLADAIINEDNSILASLSRETIEMLLS
jgi:superfamily II DNA or RNA helicase